MAGSSRVGRAVVRRFCAGCRKMSTMAVVAERVEVLDLPSRDNWGRVVVGLRCGCGHEVEETWGRAPVDSGAGKAV